ncbi:11613_t:CDS:1, partial [Dentiscutata erythropus]
ALEPADFGEASSNRRAEIYLNVKDNNRSTFEKQLEGKKEQMRKSRDGDKEENNGI